MRMNKADVDFIKGISPAIAIEQKVSTRTSRSTVGTLTEIYDYLRILFARVGRTISPVSGKQVKKDSVSDVVNYVNSLEEGEIAFVLSPFRKIHHRSVKDELNIILQKGFVRVFVDGEVKKIEDLLDGSHPELVSGSPKSERMLKQVQHDPALPPNPQMGELLPSRVR